MAFYQFNLVLTSEFWTDLALIDRENYRKHQTYFSRGQKDRSGCKQLLGEGNTVPLSLTIFSAQQYRAEFFMTV